MHNFHIFIFSWLWLHSLILSFWENSTNSNKSIPSPNPTTNPTLHCKSCNAPIGHDDPATEGYKIFKWATTIHPASSSSPPSPPFSIQKWISARLLSLIENQAVRKFHVHVEGQDNGERDVLFVSFFCVPLIPRTLYTIYIANIVYSSGSSPRTSSSPAPFPPLPPKNPGTIPRAP